jgi:two-component system, OmpR family, alkaline phosphatase synthesis response regulator PhoP
VGCAPTQEGWNPCPPSKTCGDCHNTGKTYRDARRAMTKKLLIVDDEPHIRLLLEQTLEELEDQGVELLTADNGEDALEMIATEKPNLVFLDVMMPKMNGFDVCHKVKNELKLEDVFIIMLTAKGQEFDRQKGNDVGADIYMTKPFDPDEVLEKSMEVLGLS